MGPLPTVKGAFVVKEETQNRGRGRVGARFLCDNGGSAQEVTTASQASQGARSHQKLGEDGVSPRVSEAARSRAQLPLLSSSFSVSSARISASSVWFAAFCYCSPEKQKQKPGWRPWTSENMAKASSAWAEAVDHWKHMPF